MAEVTIDPRYSKHSNIEIERILDSVETIDETPTPESGNPVSSGGTATAISEAVSDRPTNEEMAEALGGYYTKEQVDELLAQKQDTVALATEQEVIDIVENFGKDPGDDDSEPEPEPEGE